MPKMTLLELTQDILSDLDSDEVNSIADTVEAQQVSQILKTTFYEIITERKFPHLRQLFQISNVDGVSKPIKVKFPDNMSSLESIKYNTRTSTDTKDIYKDIVYKTPEVFLDYLNLRDSSKSNITSMTDEDGITLLIRNDKAPEYWTSFDDEYVWFDSYDSGVDSFIQNSKLQCLGYREPIFSLTDSFVPDLPSNMFPYLLSEAKSTCFLVLKQAPNTKEEQRAARQRRRMAHERYRTEEGAITFVSYGRK